MNWVQGLWPYIGDVMGILISKIFGKLIGSKEVSTPRLPRRERVRVTAHVRADTTRIRNPCELLPRLF